MKRSNIIGSLPQTDSSTSTEAAPTESKPAFISKNIPNAPPSKLRQFLFTTWKPQTSWKSTILLYFTVGVACILYAYLLSNLNASVVEVSVQYDNICGITNDCTITMNVPKLMKQPVYLYYGIDDFRQNFRYYLRSKNNNQLAGKDITFAQANSSCFPAVTNADLGQTVSWGGKPLVADAIASPCGLIAKSFFTDKFELWKETTNITLSDKNIAFPATVGTKHKRIENSADLQWIDPENEHFIVWMNIASHTSFRKLWAIVNQDLEAGLYTMKIKNIYNVNAFGGKKHVVLSTTSAMGGKNAYPSLIFYMIGFLFIGVAVYIAVRWKTHISDRRFGTHKIIILDK